MTRPRHVSHSTPRFYQGGFALALMLLAAGQATACDGKSYKLPIDIGANVSGGGLTVRLDKAKLSQDDPDKYFVSVKDDGAVLADHAPLRQFDSLDFKTRCGTVSIGIDRAFSFGSSRLAVTWSYF